MSFNNNTVSSTGSASSIMILQRIQALGDSRKKKREKSAPQLRTHPDPIEVEPDIDTSVYTPDGHVEGDEHGIRLDISA